DHVGSHRPRRYSRSGRLLLGSHHGQKARPGNLMLTVLWAAKGGTGTTLTACALALAQPLSTMLVDLDGDVPRALGIGSRDRPGLDDWLASDAPDDHLADLLIRGPADLVILPARRDTTPRPTDRMRRPQLEERWTTLATWCADWASQADRHAYVDAGTGEPPPQFVDAADRALLVTRRCFLGLSLARQLDAHPTGLVLLDEHGRTMPTRAITEAVGAPIVARVRHERAVFQAVDAGLATAPLPRSTHRALRPLLT
ncbi:MAG: hypothetical protein AAGA42_15280, partial [Actinomycetota bacterium]